MEAHCIVTVRYLSGREEKFKMELWIGMGTEERLKAFVAKPDLLLKTGKEVIIIPGSAIECVTIEVPKGDSRFDFPDAIPATKVK
jgi:hypothetical protein